MEEKVLRYRAPSPFGMVVEVVRRETGELVYRRLFEGEVVVEGTIPPEALEKVKACLGVPGWQVE